MFCSQKYCSLQKSGRSLHFAVLDGLKTLLAKSIKEGFALAGPAADVAALAGAVVGLAALAGVGALAARRRLRD